MTREEAIRVVKTTKDWSELREALAVLVPELAESEDDKAKRLILDLPFKHEADYKFVKDWLEKQKEPKPVDLPPGFYFITPDGKRYYSKEFRFGDIRMKVVENEKKVDK